MPTFKTRPAAMMLALIKGEEDILTPLVASRQSAITSTPCPRCGTALRPVLAPVQALFNPNDPLPKMLGHCDTCEFEASAESGLIYSTGDGRKVDDPFPVIRPDRKS